MNTLLDKIDLPVTAVLPQLLDVLRHGSGALLSAAPGAGKTTVVPAALLEFPGRIILLEPRRVAARAAARRISYLLGKPLGTVCGYTVRGDSKTSASTRIHVVTEGVFLRMIADDPALEGVNTVIFDEFHERNLASDLALALTLDARRNLCDDLKILLMSATLDATAPAALLGGVPVIDAPGRMFPVQLHWSDHMPDFRSLVPAVLRTIHRALHEEPEGDLLVFLPGTGEIRACAEHLASELPSSFRIMPLHGSLSGPEQDAALECAPPGCRKIVLATNVAESSITVEGIRVVVDSGWERRLRYDPAAGISFLEPMRISQASAAQRAGRAGRTAPGAVYRLWNELEHRPLPEQTPPEILSADLSTLVLAAAEWGTAIEELQWLDSPPPPQLAVARNLLTSLGAFDESGRLTRNGRLLARLPVAPRLGMMLLRGAELQLLPLAAELAALLEERDAFLAFPGADLRDRVRRMRSAPGNFRRQLLIRDQLLREFGVKFHPCDVESCGLLIAFAFPEWIARNRSHHGTRFAFACGSGGVLREEDDLRGAEFLAVARLGATPGRETAIQLAAPLAETELNEFFQDRIVTEDILEFDREKERVIARRIEKLGEMTLHASPIEPPPISTAKLLLETALESGVALPPPEAKNAVALLQRLHFAAKREPELFDSWLPEDFRARLPELLAPHLAGLKTLRELQALDWLQLLRDAAGFTALRELDHLYPDTFTTPLGAHVKIDYSREEPTLAIRIQELYGVTRHPAVGRRNIPLRIELLSPARRTVQITMDLPGFWRGNWPLVQKEMRSRYPKHFWPDDPAAALPTVRTRAKMEQ